MSTYQRYQKARDTAWRTLLRFQVSRLPLDMPELARKTGIAVLPFPDSGEAPKLLALIRQAGKGNCVSLRIRGAWQIFLFPGAFDENETRFALAHELGHIILGHETYALAAGVRAFRSNENAGDLLEDPLSPDDYIADIFAIRLLSPACVLHALGVHQPGAIANLCGLPPQAAAQRAARMGVLNQRNAFFTHPLERQVWMQFQPFIQARLFPSPVNPVGPDRREPLIAPSAAAPVSFSRKSNRISKLLSFWKSVVSRVWNKMSLYRQK